jgi:hypothetical protein
VVNALKRLGFIIFLLSFGLYAKEFKHLKPLNEYKDSEYNLKSGIEYVEIRTYFGKNKENREQYDEDNFIKEISIKSKTYDNKFKNIKPNFEDAMIRKHKICRFMGCFYRISLAFVQMSDKNIIQLNRVEDIVNLFDNIKTPAELNLVLWLNDINKHRTDYEHNESYKKVKNGYEVISIYQNSVLNFGECGVFKYKLFVNDKGTIEKKILLEKKLKEDCVVAD